MEALNAASERRLPLPAKRPRRVELYARIPDKAADGDYGIVRQGGRCSYGSQ